MPLPLFLSRSLPLTLSSSLAATGWLAGCEKRLTRASCSKYRRTQCLKWSLTRGWRPMGPERHSSRRPAFACSLRPPIHWPCEPSDGNEAPAAGLFVIVLLQAARVRRTQANCALLSVHFCVSTFVSASSERDQVMATRTALGPNALRNSPGVKRFACSTPQSPSPTRHQQPAADRRAADTLGDAEF